MWPKDWMWPKENPDGLYRWWTVRVWRDEVSVGFKLGPVSFAWDRGIDDKILLTVCWLNREIYPEVW